MNLPQDWKVVNAGEHSVIIEWDKVLQEERYYTDLFSLGSAPNDTKWYDNLIRKLLLFPNGNRTPGTVSAFLECVTANERDEPWHLCAAFQIVLENVGDPMATHRYSKKETDWGFSVLVTHQQLKEKKENQQRPILENNQFKVRVLIKEIYDETGTLWHKFEDWDSKKETGFVGIKNQGATCYLNSLLQSLYFTNAFRKAVYAIPTEDADSQKDGSTPTNKGRLVAYALQRLFYEMQTSLDAVSTRDLTKSFGWNTIDAFYQHDVQELNRVLQDMLEETMKGTKVEGVIEKLFTGSMKSFIKCKNVDFTSERSEVFYDVGVSVKGFATLEDSFKEYIATETMDGENQYFAEGYGLQDAIKGVIFTKLPQVLQIQLKRFEYDFERDQFVKVNDRHEFGLTLDLDDYLESIFCSLDAGEMKVDGTVKHRYKLQAVLVHSGDMNAGHYFALIRTGAKWYRFDDDKVIPVTQKEALEDNYGGSSGELKNGKRYFTNAYMLVYIREDCEANVLCPVTDDDVPQHLKDKVKKDEEDRERLRKEIEERHLWCDIKLLTTQDLPHQGFDLGFEHATTWKVKREWTMKQVYEEFARAIDVPVECVRLWNVVTRQNKTNRLECPLLPTEDKIGDFDAKQKGTRLFAEIKRDLGTWSEDMATLVLKMYDPTSGLQILGTEMLPKREKIGVLLKRVEKLLGTDVAIFEEIKPGMVEEVDPFNTLEDAELMDGDILVFQKREDPSVADYYEDIQNRIELVFVDVETKDEHRLHCDMRMGYDDVTCNIAKKIQHNPNQIRLYQLGSNGSIRHVIKTGLTLKEMLGYSHVAGLGYELLDMDVRELERKRMIKFNLDGEWKQILVEKTSTVGDLVEFLDVKNVRVFEALSHRKAREFKLEDPVSLLNEYAQLFIVTLSETELAVRSGQVKGMVVDGFHFQRDTYKTWGIPFHFVLLDEELSVTKERLAKTIGISLKEMEKIKIKWITKGNKMISIEDEKLVQVIEEDGSIGLDHVDKNRQGSGGGGIKIQ